MKSYRWLVVCAALFCTVHGRPSNDELREALEELREFLHLESKVEEQAPTARGRLNERGFDPFDFNGPVLPEDFTLELTEQDMLDLAEEDVDDDELRKQEHEIEELEDEIVELSNLDKRALEAGTEHRKNLEADMRKKRGLTSILSWAFTLGSSAFSLYNTLTKGCGIYPSICSDKDVIERLTKDIDDLKDQFDEKYIVGLNDYLQLQTVMDNNWYIKFYIDQALQSFESIDNITKRTETYLAAHLVTLTQIYNSGNMTSEEYLEAVIGQLQFGLEEIEKMLADAQKQSAKGLAINLGSRIFMSYFLNTYKKVREANPSTKNNRLDNVVDPDMSDADRNALGDTNNPNHKSVMRRIGARIKGGLLSLGSAIKRKLSLVGKTFYHMARRPFAYISGSIKAAGGAKQFFKPRRIFNSLKSKAIGKAKAVMTKFKSSWNTIRTSGMRQFLKPGFKKISWSSSLSVAISGIMAGIEVYQGQQMWAQVRDQMREQRINYENYKHELDLQMQNLTDDMTKQELEFEKSYDNFANLTGNFKEIIATAAEHTEIADANNIGFHYDMDNPIFQDGYFDVINKENVESKQHYVLIFIKDDMNGDFFSAQEMLDGRAVFYEICLDNYEKSNSVAHTYDKVISTMDYSGSLEKADYGRKLSERDVVCFYAIVLSDLDQYDFYPLQPMRPTCDVTEQAWHTMQQQARITRYRSLIEQAVTSNLNDGIDKVNDITRNVVWSFNHGNDPNKMDFATTIQNKDILCVIARIKPDNYFDFYALALYRDNDCSAITEEQVRQSEEDASRMRVQIESVRTYSDLCGNPLFPNCLCFSTIVQALKATDPSANEGTVKKLLHTLNPDSSQWCASAMYSTFCTPMCVPY